MTNKIQPHTKVQQPAFPIFIIWAFCFVSFGLKVSENDENKVVSLSASYLIYLLYFFSISTASYGSLYTSASCIHFTFIYFYHECICLKICLSEEYSGCRFPLKVFYPHLLSLASPRSLVPEWLLRRAPSESLSSSCQGPRCPCAPQALRHTAGETSAFSGHRRAQSQDLSLRRPMCVEVLLTAAVNVI